MLLGKDMVGLVGEQHPGLPLGQGGEQVRVGQEWLPEEQEEEVEKHGDESASHELDGSSCPTELMCQESIF